MSEFHPSRNRITPVSLPSVQPNGNGSGAAHEAESSTVGSLKRYFGAMRRHWRLVLGITVAFLGLAALKAYNDPPEYRSTTMVQLSDTRKMLAGSMVGAGMGSVGFGGNPMRTQIQILKSRTVMAGVVDAVGYRLQPLNAKFRFGVVRDIEVSDGTPADTILLRFSDSGVEARSHTRVARATYGEPVVVEGVRFTVVEHPGVEETRLVVVSRADAAAVLQRDVQAEPRYDTDVIDVSYTANDPLVSQRVANAVAESFRAYNAGTAQEEARRRAEFVQQQVERTDSMLVRAQMALASFRQRENLYSSQVQMAAEQQQRTQLDLERAQLAAEHQTYRTLLTSLEQSRADGNGISLPAIVSLDVVAANPIVASQLQQLQQLQFQRDTVTDGRWQQLANNSDVQRLNRLIEATQDRLVRAVRSQLLAYDAQLASLDNLAQSTSRSIGSLPATESEEVRLLASVEHYSTIAKQLRADFQHAQIEKAVQAGNVEIVDPARPGDPVSGSRLRTLLFGLIFGLALGGGGALLAENLNTAIRRKSDVEKLLHIPELAVVPRIGAAPAISNRMRLPVQIFGSGAGKPLPVDNSKDLVAANQPQTPGAEAYRTLRTNLIFSQSIQSLRTMVVTSSAPAEGKSTTAANLAITFAQQGLRVLLVDCDLRKARLHKAFGVPREPGLSNLVLGLKTTEEVVRPTAVENLYFLPGGTLPPNPSEMVGGAAMRAVADSLAGQFDLVIFDTPPLLAAADAAILGRHTDGVLLVIRAGQTERDMAVQAVQQLHSVGARILGAVLNDPDSKVGKYGGHYHYEYYGAEA